MAKYQVVCSARATIREMWHVEADSADEARDIFADYSATGEGSPQFIYQDVDGDEEDREVMTVLELPAAGAVSARLEAEVRYGFHPNHGNQT